MQIVTPQIVTDTDQLRRILRGWRGAGASVALAPTMGNFHDGHAALIETARRHASRVVVSVFGGIDLSRASLLDRDACDLVFAPEDARGSTHVQVTPSGIGTRPELDRMTTSLARLFNQVQPDVAVFGEKDWVQLVTIRRMVRDLAMPVGVVSSATIREEDGLAVSTRNRMLTARERVTAPTLHKVLTASAGLIARGASVQQVIGATRRFLAESGFDAVHHVSARRASDLVPLERFDPAKPARLMAAVQLGRVRLSDNVPITGMPS